MFVRDEDQPDRVAGSVGSPSSTSSFSTRAINAQIARKNVVNTLWINIWLVIFTTITFGPVFDKYVLQLSHKNAVVGLVESISGFTSLAVFIPVAWLVDTYVKQRAILVTVSGWIGIASGAVLVVALCVDNFRVLFPALVTNGIFYELYSSASEALFADSAAIIGDRQGWYVKKQTYLTVACGIGPLLTLILAYFGKVDIKFYEGATHSEWHSVGTEESNVVSTPSNIWTTLTKASGGLPRLSVSFAGDNLSAGVVDVSSSPDDGSSFTIIEQSREQVLSQNEDSTIGVPKVAIVASAFLSRVAESVSTLVQQYPSIGQDASSTTVNPPSIPSFPAGHFVDHNGSIAMRPQTYLYREDAWSLNKDGNTWSLSFMHLVLAGGVSLGVPILWFIFGYQDLIRDGGNSDEDEVTKQDAALNELTYWQKWVPYICGISDFVTAVGAGMTVKFFNLFFIEDYKFTPVQICILQTFYPLSIAFFTMILGKIASVFGRAQTSISSFVLNAVFFILLSKIQNIKILIMIFLIRGGLANGVGPLDRSILMDFTPSSQRGRWNALESFTSLTWSGSAFLGGYIADNQDYRQTFHYTSYLYLFSSLFYLPLLWLVPRKGGPGDHRMLNEQNLDRDQRERRGAGDQEMLPRSPVMRGGLMASPRNAESQFSQQRMEPFLVVQGTPVTNPTSNRRTSRTEADRVEKRNNRMHTGNAREGEAPY